MMLIRGDRALLFTSLRISHQINSTAMIHFDTPEDIRIGDKVMVRGDDDKLLFYGYVNYISLDYKTMRRRCKGVASPILNKLMQYSYTFPDSEFRSWGVVMLRFLQSCGVRLHPHSYVPSNNIGRGYLYGTMAQPGATALDTFLKLHPFFGRIETEGSKRYVTVKWDDIINNLIEETGRDLFWVLYDDMIYVGVKGAAGFEVDPTILTSAVITEDATQIVESLQNIQVVY